MIKRALFSEPLAVGQVWLCEARTHDTNPTITILKIDEDNSGKILGVRIDGINLKNPSSKDGFSSFIQHVPIEEAALKLCLVGLKASNTELTQEMLEGYDMWKEQYSQGKAGGFDIPLGEIIENIENTLCSSVKSTD